ncbi:ABC transporter permease [Cellulomonas bogoriensis]|uniref:Nitrate ABC transporter permease n=1 Tax=Cellulomonas bogoriensis 69B4 = DSM 16987 TaxID=1386082 RepID=A0A0A0BML9_9CELL|nr:ABC transporter permease [Cellulomonas bogoriensis]KGM09160.1 nitrate ABC transporter permease [Cellulomonas bogoriensis 69B4 = DSM 16987]
MTHSTLDAGQVPAASATTVPPVTPVLVPERGARPTRSRSQRRKDVLDVVLPVLVFVGLVALWYLISYVVLAPERRFLLPPPHDVVRVGFGDPANLQQIMQGLGRTTVIAMLGLAISVVVGFTFAILMASARWIERSLFPYAVVIQAIPILALVPLMGFWFGYGMTARVIVCVICSLFPIVANTLFGLQSVDRGQLDLFRLHGAPRSTIFAKLLIPAAIPSVFTGFRISAGASVIGAIVGDTYFRQGAPGIGVLIDLYRSRLQSEQLFAAIIASSVLGVVVFMIFTWLGRRIVGSWHATGRSLV